jgi:hypothetical protein
MKDEVTIMAAVLGASTTVASLVLVLQGYLLSALANTRAQDDPSVKAPYKRGAVASLVALILSVLVALGSTSWMLGFNLFWLTAIGFLVSLVSVIALSVIITISACRT